VIPLFGISNCKWSYNVKIEVQLDDIVHLSEGIQYDVCGCDQGLAVLTVGELLKEAVQRSGGNDVDDWFLQEVVCAEELGQYDELT